MLKKKKKKSENHYYLNLQITKLCLMVTHLANYLSPMPPPDLTNISSLRSSALGLLWSPSSGQSRCCVVSCFVWR